MKPMVIAPPPMIELTNSPISKVQDFVCGDFRFRPVATPVLAARFRHILEEALRGDYRVRVPDKQTPFKAIGALEFQRVRNTCRLLYFRDLQDFKGKNVLVVGARASRIDIFDLRHC